jgi:hypothetical protein
MKIIKAKIVWFPEKINSITVDYLADQGKIPWEKNHLNKVRSFMEQDGLLFPGVSFQGEIHCGHYRFRIAKEMGYDGMQMYEASDFKDVLSLTQFTELCYKHYKEYKEKKYL